jgi:hypothetical protein
MRLVLRDGIIAHLVGMPAVDWEQDDGAQCLVSEAAWRRDRKRLHVGQHRSCMNSHQRSPSVKGPSHGIKLRGPCACVRSLFLPRVIARGRTQWLSPRGWRRC